MSDRNERGTVRVLFETIRLESREVEGAVVEGLAVAGFDVEIEPDVKPGKILGTNQQEGGVTLKVYRRLDRV